jgi:hypothetical protein
MKGTCGACGACSTRGVRVGRTDQPEQRGDAVLEQEQEYARHRHLRGRWPSHGVLRPAARSSAGLARLKAAAP